MTTPSKRTKSRPGSPSNDRLISGNLRTEKAFRTYLEKNFPTDLEKNFPTVNKLTKRKKKSKQKANSQKNNSKNKRNTKRNHNARISMQAIHGFNAIPISRAKTNKKLKMEGGGDGEFDMQADATTSSAQGALDSSIGEQKGRNSMDNELKGQLGGASFIPPAGMDMGDAMSLKGVADSITQGRASAVGDNDIPRKPCGDQAAIGGRRKKRRTRKRRRKSKKRKTRRTRRKRRTRKRKVLKKLRFSKMPPKYL